MDKKRVLIDVDNVSLDFGSVYLDFMNQLYGQDIRPEEVGSARIWDFPDRRGVINKYRLLRFLFWSDFLDLPPVEGAVEGVEAVRRDYDILFGTSRTRFVHRATLNSMRKHFGDVAVYAKYHLYWKADGDVKLKISKKQGVDFVVEDDPWAAIKLGLEGVRGVLFSRQYNRGYDLRAMGWYRAENWGEVKPSLDKLARGENPLLCS